MLREINSGLGDYLPAVACDWWEGDKCVYFGLDYITLRGRIIHSGSLETLQDAQITFSSPAMHQTFTGTMELRLPGGAVVDFAVQAPGYLDANGQIKIDSDFATFILDRGFSPGEQYAIYAIEDSNQTIEWNASLLVEPPPSTNTPQPQTIVTSKPRFQVFILNPVNTCLAGNDFASGNVCFGSNCSCTWEQFDPPAPMLGIPPSQINDQQYAEFTHRVCLEITLKQQEIDDIIADMNLIRNQVYEWSGGALDLQMQRHDRLMVEVYGKLKRTPHLHPA